MPITISREEISDMHASCVCLQTRSKARFLTQAYDRILAPSGLKITQFSVLSVLLAGPLTIGEIADLVDIDRTTLARNLMPLQRDGYVTLNGGQDARTRIMTLTTKSVRATEQAFKLWKQAQAIYAAPEIATG